MCAFLNKAAILEHENSVAVFDGRQPVRDKEHRVVFTFIDDVFEKLILCNRIEST